ncbi:hypothetical protein ACFYRC_37900 [Streptomyces sp. NPDC005279]|uniref:hypothetical protein n=1 Tax=Streptomyces sp. NPDC005279 TaxID=3364712 RepID=UPI0036CFC331
MLTQVEVLEQEDRLTRYQYLPSIQADLLQRLGRIEEAEAERAFLTGRSPIYRPAASGMCLF